MTKPFHELSGKEQEKLFQEAAREERRKIFKKGWCCVQAGINDAVSFAFPPDGAVRFDKKDIREAIEFAIRTNQAEEIDTSKNIDELLDQVHFGELTLDQVRKLIQLARSHFRIV